MTVLVTGGTGWIGSHVVKELAARKRQVVTFDSTREAWRVNHLAGVLTVKGDILDLPGLIGTIQAHRVTHIIHLAAILKGESQRNPRLLYKVNCEGTINVLEAAKLSGIQRVVYGSSSVVYGLTLREPVDEAHTTSPIDMYGATKVLGETYLKDYHRLFGLDYAVMRFAHVYGPGRLRGTAVWKDLFEYPARGETYALPSGGDHLLNWSYVKDCATATVAACFAEELDARIFNVCEGVQHTPREIAELIASRLVPGARYEIGPGLVPGHPAEHCLDIRRARQQLGWQPEYDLERGCRDYLQEISEARPQ